MVMAINANRTAPVTEDLTTEDLSISVIRGLESVFRKDVELAEGVEIEKGEWGVLNADSKLERPGASATGNAFVVFNGTKRFDAHATGKVTILMGSFVAKTSKYDTNPSYAVNDFLTVRNLGGGEAIITKASTGEGSVGRVLEVGNGYLVFEYIPAAVAP